MLHRFGLAVVEERTQPSRSRGLRAYLRAEYGRVTDLGFHAAKTASPSHVNRRARGFGGNLRVALVTRVRGLLSARPPSLARSDLACDGCGTPR